MKLPLSLRAKVLLLAALNLVLLAALILVFLQLQLERSFEGFLATVGGAQVLAAAESLSDDLEATPRAEWNRLLADYSERYGVGFHLFLNEGGQVAGKPVTPPAAVLRWLRVRAPPDGRGGPPADRGGPPPGSPVPDVPPFLEVVDTQPYYWIGVRMGVPQATASMPSRGTLLLTSDTLFASAFLVPWRPWLAVIGLALGIVLLCWLPFVHGVTGTVRSMTKTTQQIAEGRLDARVSADRGDELGLLGESINRMGGQLGALIHGQKRFLRDAAHELRSPLGRMQIATSILERDLESSPHQQRLADLREDVEEMTELTDQILAFGRAESQTEAVELGPVRIGDIVHRAVKIERRDHPDIRIDLNPDLEALGNTDMLLRCFSNLIRNAVLHGGVEGPIAVSGSVDDGQVRITVADSGPGVPEDCLDKLFGPFFRVEAARTRNAGGAGLGLAIVKTCVEACRGTVTCRNGDPTGLEVTVVLEGCGINDFEPRP